MEMMVHGTRDEQYNHHHLGLGLGLSLSLSLGVAGAVDEPPRRVAASVAHVSSLPAAAPPSQQQCSWTSAAGLFSSSDRRTTMACNDEMPFLRGIDVNRAPAETRGVSCSEEDEEPGASSPNSTLSSLSGKRGVPARAATAAAGGSDDEDSGAGGGSRKKLRLSKDQAAVLEDTFKEHNTLNPVSSNSNPSTYTNQSPRNQQHQQSDRKRCEIMCRSRRRRWLGS
ncbi:hypothetical protein E2562_006155 [Oryza meyeriana var. granulata]|uniref:HD-ZIP protein N-terminal domain-containing protein n=1 Tax=Oryza meyeriana var. granulata TaxID=110450 RepID=A0A6G1EVS4_9ORYZ|nr:hypothetical protein E2562_006155 [Oryza meyeriana var. granulata]